MMPIENEIASEYPVEVEAEAAPEEAPVSQPETEPGEDAEEAPQPEPDPPAAEEIVSVPGCPIEIGRHGPRCFRKLHAAPGGVDERPVCLMHSKDSNKELGPLSDAFWLEFERTLEEAGKNEANFEQFVFPAAYFYKKKFKAICLFQGAVFTQYADFSSATFTQDTDFSFTTFT